MIITVSQKSSKIFFMMILFSVIAGMKRAKSGSSEQSSKQTQRQSRRRSRSQARSDSGAGAELRARMKMVGLKSLLADSRIPFSNKVENLKNISLDIFILIQIMKNWKG